MVNINKSSANRQNNTVIAVNGPLGYNEASFIKRYFKEKHPNVNVTIFCERLMNTKEYLNHLLREQNWPWFAFIIVSINNIYLSNTVKSRYCALLHKLKTWIFSVNQSVK